MARRVFVYECVSAGGLGINVPASLLREGRAMRDAVAADFERISGVEVITLDHDEAFAQTARNCEWTLVIAPEFDDLLASRCRTALAMGSRLLGPLPNAVDVTSDKLATARWWEQHGVPHPWTALLTSADLTRRAPPWVVKPRWGAGSQAMHLVHDVATVDSLASTRDDYLVQQYVPGQPASVSLLIGPVQTIALCPARQHLSGDGRFQYLGGSLPMPADLAERATKLALRAVAGIEGLQGYVGVDLVLGDRDYVIEINPRITTSYLGLRQLSEANLADLMWKVVHGERIQTPAWRAGEVEFQV